MQEVKIVACSDLHGIASFEQVAERAIAIGAQVVVVAGDVQTAFAGRHPGSAFLEDILRPSVRLQEAGIDILLVPGNHDFYLRKQLYRSSGKRDLQRLHILCDRKFELHGLTFYGTPWCPWINGRWCYEADDGVLAKRFAQIPMGVDVLVTHSPPLGIDSELWDVSLQDFCGGLAHYGSLALRKTIERRKPRCVICGHIHTGSHAAGRIGETVILNVSLLNERYEEAFAPAELVFGADGQINTIIQEEYHGRSWK